jgi:hypothetical protein
MMRRVALAAGVLAAVACGSDQSTNSTTPPPPTAAELALHFDTLAGELHASNPADVRLQWYQAIASILARGASPTVLSAQARGELAVFEVLTEVDAYPDSIAGKKITDSSYRLAAWAPSTRPNQFVDLRVRFVPAGTGQPDTLVRSLTLYSDTTGASLVDSTAAVGVDALSSRGTCVLTPLENLTVPTNPCSKVIVDWLVDGGTGLLTIDPAAQISGTHLTH